MQPDAFMNEETLFLIQFLGDCKKKIPLSNRMRILSSDLGEQPTPVISKLVIKLVSSCSNPNTNHIFDLFRDVSRHLHFKSQTVQAPSATPALCSLRASAQIRLGAHQCEQGSHAPVSTVFNAGIISQ